MTVSAVPEGFHSITPYLIVDGAAQALEFYAKAFGAEELMRMEGPGGTIGHAEFRVGSSRLMLADSSPEMKMEAPGEGPTSMFLMLYIEDVDTVFKRALDAGARELRPVTDQFYGDRSGMLRDPFGHVWTVATHVEDVSEEEMERRMREMH